MSFIPYDVVIKGGRVMDPENKFDAIRNVGIANGKIVSITEKDINGTETIDAKGLVVAPGFMEAHFHGTDQYTLKAALRDGLTTCMDFEAGIRDVDNWYAAHHGKSQVNYGHVCCAAFARLAVLDGPDIAEHGHDSGDLMSRCLPLAAKRAKEEGRPMGWNATLPDKLQMTQIMTVLDEELRQGALGVGIPVGYMTHGITSYEMYKYQELASLYGRVSNAHARFIGKMPPLEGALGIQELMCNAMVLNAPVMVAHVNSMNDWEFTIGYVNKARANGHKVFAEAYPYHAGSSTAAADVLLPENMKSLGITYNDVYYVEPYERWTKEIYDKRMENGEKMMILELNKEEDIKVWMADPETIICSDAMSCLKPDYGYYDWDEPLEGKSVHPRTSGTRGKFLRMIREEKSMNVDLMTAISRMTYLPAKYYGELCGIPHFRWKGRMQVGCDADIAIFDPDTVTDNSSFDIGQGMNPTTGIPYVLVNGVITVKDSVVQKVFPGQPIRFPIQPKGRVTQMKIDPPYRPTMGENTRHIEHMNFPGCC